MPLPRAAITVKARLQNGRSSHAAVHGRRAVPRPCSVLPPVEPAQYARASDLARLLPLWPEELADASVAGRRRLIARLCRALRAERSRGLAGHWTYDLARHAQLRTALDAELAELSDLVRRGPGRGAR